MVKSFIFILISAHTLRHPIPVNTNNFAQRKDDCDDTSDECARFVGPPASSNHILGTAYYNCTSERSMVLYVCMNILLCHGVGLDHR